VTTAPVPPLPPEPPPPPPGSAPATWPAARQAWLLDHSEAYWGRTLSVTPAGDGSTELLTWDYYLVLNDWAATVGNFASKPLGWQGS